MPFTLIIRMMAHTFAALEFNDAITTLRIAGNMMYVYEYHLYYMYVVLHVKESHFQLPLPTASDRHCDDVIQEDMGDKRMHVVLKQI